ncbi:hypothetical protein Tco_0113442 [Tanacetum coccineum]
MTESLPKGFEREAAYAAGRVARAHCADGCPRARALMRLKESMDSVLQVRSNYPLNLIKEGFKDKGSKQWKNKGTR